VKTVPSIGSLVVMVLALPKDSGAPAGSIRLAVRGAYRQRLQELFFPEGIAFNGIRFNRTAVTALLFR
jgi:hypothetical protein